MKRETKPSDRELSQVIERQMRNWEIARTQKTEVPAPLDMPVQPFIAVSRSVGLPGLRIAECLGARLGWPVFVRQVLQAMSGDDEYRRRLYAVLDGRDMNWLESVLRSMGIDKYAQDDYFRRLTGTILSIARKGPAVFLGRAADLILPQQAGCRVRLWASKDYCLRSYAQQKNIAPDQAEREVEDIENERAAFIRRHFHVEPDDPVRYDMIVNMERFGEDQTGELILSAARLKGIGG